ncbi:histidine kinase [Methylobacterium sp. J-088]|uniref:histidine kinase n=1 Tax=Methylobacterium sp. J-088 TaxID=2836664 RepID=UPI001FBBA60F|nr:histidine kinase [Methylobacterium sp. J-088]MCJ2065293.1 histidine kinase [Methylobacterium sp. J-088]
MAAAFWTVWAICAVSVTVSTLVWATRAREEALAAAHEDATRVSRSGVQFIENAFGVVDVLLKRLTEIAEEKDFDSASVDSLCPSLICSNFQRLSPYLLIGFVRANGELLTYGPDAQQMNFAEQDYFIAQKERDVGFFVGAPWRTPLIQGVGLPMSRRLSTKDGAFAGIIGAVINVDLVHAFFQGLGAGKADGITLRDDKGRRLIAWSAVDLGNEQGSAGTSGEPTCGSPSIRPSPDDITSTTQATVGGLSLDMCRSATNILRSWRTEVSLVAGTEALLLLGPALAFPALRRWWERRARQQMGLRGVVDEAFDVQFIIAAQSDGTFVLEALTLRLEGEGSRATAHLVGRTTRELFPLEDAEAVEAEYRGVLASGETRRVERRVNLGGSQFVWNTVLVPLGDAGTGYIFGAATDVAGDGAFEGGLRRFTENVLRREDNERRRIARELHDTTGQNLIAAGFELGVADRGLVDPPPRVRAALTQARALIDASVAEVRTLSYVLHPALLDEAGLGLALATLADGFERRAGIQVRVSVDEVAERRWARGVELALYRVAQEALTNVQRHSSTKRARLTLRPDASANLELTIEDGSGELPPGAAFPIVEGSGIRGMRDRLEALGGTLAVVRLTTGLRVTAKIPPTPMSDEA